MAFSNWKLSRKDCLVQVNFPLSLEWKGGGNDKVFPARGPSVVAPLNTAYLFRSWNHINNHMSMALNFSSRRQQWTPNPDPVSNDRVIGTAHGIKICLVDDVKKRQLIRRQCGVDTERHDRARGPLRPRVHLVHAGFGWMQPVIGTQM